MTALSRFRRCSRRRQATTADSAHAATSAAPGAMEPLGPVPGLRPSNARKRFIRLSSAAIPAPAPIGRNGGWRKSSAMIDRFPLVLVNCSTSGGSHITTATPAATAHQEPILLSVTRSPRERYAFTATTTTVKAAMPPTRPA